MIIGVSCRGLTIEKFFSAWNVFISKVPICAASVNFSSQHLSLAGTPPKEKLSAMRSDQRLNFGFSFDDLRSKSCSVYTFRSTDCVLMEISFLYGHICFKLAQLACISLTTSSKLTSLLSTYLSKCEYFGSKMIQELSSFSQKERSIFFSLMNHTTKKNQSRTTSFLFRLRLARFSNFLGTSVIGFL